MAHEPVLFTLDTTKGPVEFRFTVSSTLALERSAGCAPWVLAARGQSVTAMVLMLQFAMRHADATYTEAKAEKDIQRYLKQGGKAKDLADALAKAMRASGVYGDTETETAEETPETAPDPQTATETNG